MNLPNRITISRILLVPVFIGLLLYWTPALNLGPAAFAVFLVACATDAVDGLLSRRLNQKTRLGTLIDPLADKALLMSAFVGLAFFPNIPAQSRIEPWLAVIVISRDAILICGALLIAAMFGRFEPRTNFVGKATTFFQMVFVLCMFIPASGAVCAALTAVVAACTLASSAIYIASGARMLSNGAAVP